MHPHQDVCPYDGCGRTRFDAPDALPLHCWHVHGTSVFDLGALLCPHEGCELLRFEDEGRRMHHLNRVHKEPIKCAETGLSSGRDTDNGQPKRARIYFGPGFTETYMLPYVVRRIYYDDEMPPPPQQEEEVPVATATAVAVEENFYKEEEEPVEKRARTNGHYNKGGDD